MRLVVGLLFIVLARIDGLTLSLSLPGPDQVNQQQARESEEVAHWAAQLKSGDLEERRDAVMRLSSLDGDAATSALVSGLDDSSPLVRALVLDGLGERSTPAVISLIAARLASDKDPFVKKTAAYALARSKGSQRTEALITGLKDKDQEVRGAAAVALGDHPEPAAIAPLGSALTDKNDFVRAQSARALGINGAAASPAVPAMIRILGSDPDGEVKRQIAIALGLIGDRTAIPALERASRDSDSYLAQAARDSLRMIQDK